MTCVSIIAYLELSFDHENRQIQFHQTVSAPKMAMLSPWVGFLDQFYEDLHRDSPNFEHLTLLCLFHVISKEYSFLRTRDTEWTLGRGSKFWLIWFIVDDGRAVGLRRIPLQCRLMNRWIYRFIKLTSVSNYPHSVVTPWFCGPTSSWVRCHYGFGCYF